MRNYDLNQKCGKFDPESFFCLPLSHFSKFYRDLDDTGISSCGSSMTSASQFVALSFLKFHKCAEYEKSIFFFSFLHTLFSITVFSHIGRAEKKCEKIYRGEFIEKGLWKVFLRNEMLKKARYEL